MLCHVKRLNLAIIKTDLSPEQRITELECRTHVDLVLQAELDGFSFQHHLCTFAAMEVCSLAARRSQYPRSRSLIPGSRTALVASSSYHCLHSPTLRTCTWQKGFIDLDSELALGDGQILMQHCELDQQIRRCHRVGSDSSCRSIHLISQELELPLIRQLREKLWLHPLGGLRTFPDVAVYSLRTHFALQRCCHNVRHRNERIQSSPWFQRSSVFHQPQSTERVPLQFKFD